MNNIFEKPDKKTDFIKRFVEKEPDTDPVYSPMAPPEAYQPPATEQVPRRSSTLLKPRPPGSAYPRTMIGCPGSSST